MNQSILLGHYDLALVALSIAIAISASYVALDLGSRTAASKGRTRSVWLVFGAAAMGVGIWSMHYIGMLAFYLPVAVLYDLPTVGISLVAAGLASAVALFVVSREKLTTVDLCVASSIMGSGICAMHYVGMAAMRLPAHCQYNYWIVALSVVIAVLVSGAAIWITFRLRDERARSPWMRPLSSVIMGLAIATMHYTGMAAMCFRHSPSAGDTRYAVAVTSIGIAGITLVTFTILLFGLAGAIADRIFSLQREQLAATANEYRLLIERSLAGVCRTTLDGRILDANDMIVNLLGYEKREGLVGVDVSQHYWNPEDREKVVDALRKHGAVSGIEVCLKRIDGYPVWVIYSLVLAQSVQGADPEIVTSIMDISCLKKTQEDLLAAKEYAEAANRAKSQFLANMSHELRTPLNGIIGTTELALSCQISPEVREYLEISKTSANALIGIINDVLDFSSIGAQKLVLAVEPFNLKDVIDDAIRIVGLSARQKSVRLAIEISSPLPPLMSGDPGRLRQILINLLGNAVKFTLQGEVVLTVGQLSREEGGVVVPISVRDTGVGIPANKLGLIFEAFAQADSSNSRRFGGTGLGLTISSQLVKAMGGQLWVESTPGVGSTFHFTVSLGLPQESDVSDSLLLLAGTHPDAAAADRAWVRM